MVSNEAINFARVWKFGTLICGSEQSFLYFLNSSAHNLLEILQFWTAWNPAWPHQGELHLQVHQQGLHWYRRSRTRRNHHIWDSSYWTNSKCVDKHIAKEYEYQILWKIKSSTVVLNWLTFLLPNQLIPKLISDH